MEIFQYSAGFIQHSWCNYNMDFDTDWRISCIRSKIDILIFGEEDTDEKADTVHDMKFRVVMKFERNAKLNKED